MEFPLQEMPATTGSSSSALVDGKKRNRTKTYWFVKGVEITLITLLFSNLVAVIFVAVAGYILVLDASEIDTRLRSYKKLLIGGMSILTIISVLFYSFAIIATFKQWIKILIIFIILNIIMMVMIGIKTDSSQSYLNLIYHSVVTFTALIFCRIIKCGCV